MATTFTLISTITLTTTTATITFSTIPGIYTDLLLKCSTRSNDTANNGGAALEIKLNNVTVTSGVRLEGSGSAASSNTAFPYANAEPSDFTASTFGNTEFYIPNYAGSTAKSVSADSVGENNATLAYSSLNALLWSSTTAVSSIVLKPISTFSFVQYSSASLYGILKA